ncbi:MAG: CocE/NonD family hydrolase [Chloroflexota bacterium]
MMANSCPVARAATPPGVRLEPNVMVPMRDGVKLAVDIYRPEKDGKYPAILSISPYIKEIQQEPPELSHSIEAGATGFFVPRGYVHVIASIRGTGFSQGQYCFLGTKEQEDSYDLVEGIASQPWCTGNVGMIGDSYFAWSQYYTAAQQPPHLRCIAPFDGGTDIYRDLCYQGGIFFQFFVSLWGVDLIRQCLWPGPVEGKLPPSEFFKEIAEHPEDGPFYRERSAAAKIEKIKVPVLNMATAQGYLHSRGQLYVASRLRGPRKLLVLPPSSPHTNVVFLKSPAVQELLLLWLDHWLKGVENGIMDGPPVAIYDEVTKDWRYENEYPLARTEWTKFYLRANPASPASEAPYGLLSEDPAGNEAPDRYSIPECLHRVVAGQPVLAYATPPLERDLRVWGPLSAVLHASSTGRDTAWFVRVGDVAPDGKVTLLSRGNLKASFRRLDEAKSAPGQPYHPFRDPEPPEPGKIYEYQVEITPIFHTFKAGHKVWVQIASDDAEYQTRQHTIHTVETLPVPAENTVYHDAARPSHLLLPVIPDAPPIGEVKPPVSQIKWPL